MSLSLLVSLPVYASLREDGPSDERCIVSVLVFASASVSSILITRRPWPSQRSSLCHYVLRSPLLARRQPHNDATMPSADRLPINHQDSSLLTADALTEDGDTLACTYFGLWTLCFPRRHRRTLRVCPLSLSDVPPCELRWTVSAIPQPAPLTRTRNRPALASIPPTDALSAGAAVSP